MRTAKCVGCAIIFLPAVLWLTGCNTPQKRSVEAAKEPVVSAPQARPELKAAQPATGRAAGRSRNETTSGMVVYIDPATGKVIQKPQASGPGAAPSARTKPDAPELVEVPSPAPGGGSMVDLKGQLLAPLVGTVGPDGKLTVDHQAKDHESPPAKNLPNE